MQTEAVSQNNNVSYGKTKNQVDKSIRFSSFQTGPADKSPTMNSKVSFISKRKICNLFFVVVVEYGYF